MSNIKPTSPLAERIKQARLEAGLSQKKLGQAIKLSDKAVSSYEVGRAVPSLDTLKEIGKFTHKPVGYFVDDGDHQDLDLQIRIKTIEKELLEIKKILQQK